MKQSDESLSIRKGLNVKKTLFFTLFSILITVCTNEKILFCTTAECLSQNEGRIIHLQGRFIYPTKKAFAQYKILLKDNTYVIFSISDNKKPKYFSKKNNNSIMKVKGRIITSLKGLEKRGIIGTDGSPHLFDITDIKIIVKDID